MSLDFCCHLEQNKPHKTYGFRVANVGGIPIAITSIEIKIADIR